MCQLLCSISRPIDNNYVSQFSNNSPGSFPNHPMCDGLNNGKCTLNTFYSKSFMMFRTLCIMQVTTQWGTFVGKVLAAFAYKCTQRFDIDQFWSRDLPHIQNFLNEDHGDNIHNATVASLCRL